MSINDGKPEEKAKKQELNIMERDQGLDDPLGQLRRDPVLKALGETIITDGNDHEVQAKLAHEASSENKPFAVSADRPGETVAERSERKVFEAADYLVSRGEHPAQEKVKKLSGVSSNSTAVKYLQKWREVRRKEEVAKIEKEQKALVLNMPEELKAEREQADARLWDVARKLVASEINAIREDKEKALRKKDEVIVGKDEEIGELRGDVESIAQTLDEYEGKNSDLEERCDNLVRARDQLTVSNENYARVKDELENHVAELTVERDEARTERDSAKGLHIQLEKDFKNSEAKNIKLEGEVRKFSIQAAEFDEKLKIANSSLQEFRVEKEAFESQKRELESANLELSHEVTSGKKNFQKLETEFKELKKKLEAKENELNKVVIASETAKKQLEMKDSRIRELARETGELKTENKELLKQIGALESKTNTK